MSEQQRQKVRGTSDRGLIPERREELFKGDMAEHPKVKGGQWNYTRFPKNRQNVLTARGKVPAGIFDGYLEADGEFFLVPRSDKSDRAPVKGQPEKAVPSKAVNDINRGLTSPPKKRVRDIKHRGTKNRISSKKSIPSSAKKLPQAQPGVNKNLLKNNLPKAGPDIGTGVSTVSTVLDGISAFSGNMIFGALAVVGAWVSAFLSFHDAARAGDATRRMTELLAVAFATTAWMFNHPSPKTPEMLLDNVIGRASVNVHKGWQVVKRQQNLLEVWFDKHYKEVIKVANNRSLPVPTKAQVRQEIPNRIKITPQEYARVLLTSKELTSLLLPVEKNAKPSVWYDYFAKIPYEVRGQ